ncbi:hypothetical protein BU17DRAFT_64949 [Hysterangium stoloniferum]|nr:hypothetical protein BU17DRAFT_64949 [Hysterangium stoloniferum]
MEHEVVVADDERVSMARNDSLVMWPGSDTWPRDWSRVLVKSLRRSPTEQQVAYSTSSGISTNGTCKFARDGPPYAIAPPFGLTGCFSVDGMPPKTAFGVLLLLIYETIICFLMLWKTIQSYRDGYGSLFLLGMAHDREAWPVCNLIPHLNTGLNWLPLTLALVQNHATPRFNTSGPVFLFMHDCIHLIFTPGAKSRCSLTSYGPGAPPLSLQGPYDVMLSGGTPNQVAPITFVSYCEGQFGVITCAGSQSSVGAGVGYQILEQVEKKVVLIDDAMDVNLPQPNGCWPRGGFASITLKKASRDEGLTCDMDGLKDMDRIQIPNSSHIFEDSVMQVNKDRPTVEVLWHGGQKGEFKWGSIVWSWSDERGRKAIGISVAMHQHLCVPPLLIISGTSSGGSFSITLKSYCPFAFISIHASMTRCVTTCTSIHLVKQQERKKSCRTVDGQAVLDGWRHCSHSIIAEIVPHVVRMEGGRVYAPGHCIGRQGWRGVVNDKKGLLNGENTYLVDMDASQVGGQQMQVHTTPLGNDTSQCGGFVTDERTLAAQDAVRSLITTLDMRKYSNEWSTAYFLNKGRT